MTASEVQLPLDVFEPEKESLLGHLAGQASLNKVGITFPQNMPQQSWEAIGSQLNDISNSYVWWLADWMIYGESSYGSQYREALERTGLDYQTLRNYAWVARRFEHRRRREALSFAHHAEVARLSAPEQDYWLRKAEQQAWSRNQLRKQVRASIAERESIQVQPSDTASQQLADQRPLPADENGPSDTATKIEIDLSINEVDQITKIAESYGLSLNDWAARVLQYFVRTFADGDVRTPQDSSAAHQTPHPTPAAKSTSIAAPEPPAEDPTQQRRATKRHYLMCRPTHFGVVYSINPWMDLPD